MKKLFKALVAVTAVAALSGCAAVQQSGLAADVNGVQISTDALAAQYKEIADLTSPTGQLPGTPVEINRSILLTFVYATLLDELAADLNISISEAEVDRQRREILGNLGEEGLAMAAASSAIAPSQIDTQLRITIAFAKIGNKLAPAGLQAEKDAIAREALIKKAAESKIVISPRYGEWVQEGLQVGNVSEILSISAAELALLQQPVE